MQFATTTYSQELVDVIPSFELSIPDVYPFQQTKAISSDGNYVIFMKYNGKDNRPNFGTIWDMRKNEVNYILNDTQIWSDIAVNYPSDNEQYVWTIPTNLLGITK
ncbi:MAG: hypothetical protein ACLFR2_13385 [Candidatus Kapaibacterium sp.]